MLTAALLKPATGCPGSQLPSAGETIRAPLTGRELGGDGLVEAEVGGGGAKLLLAQRALGVTLALSGAQSLHREARGPRAGQV